MSGSTPVCRSCRGTCGPRAQALTLRPYTTCHRHAHTSLRYERDVGEMWTRCGRDMEDMRARRWRVVGRKSICGRGAHAYRLDGEFDRFDYRHLLKPEASHLTLAPTCHSLTLALKCHSCATFGLFNCSLINAVYISPRSRPDLAQISP